MPVLEEFHAAYGDRVALLGIDFQDAQTEKARALVEETGVTYPLVQDQAGEINGQGAFPLLRGLPFVAFVDETARSRTSRQWSSTQPSSWSPWSRNTSGCGSRAG